MGKFYPKPDVGVSDPHGNIPKLDPRGSSRDYPDARPASAPVDEQPGLTGGPAIEAVPGSHATEPLDPLKRQHERSLTNPLPGEANDGGESVLGGQSREQHGERPDPEQLDA